MSNIIRRSEYNTPTLFRKSINDLFDNSNFVEVDKLIKEIEAPQLPRTLDDVTLAVINTNYALDAKLNPTKDALVIEDKNSPYVNILVCRKGEENRPEIQALAKILNSPEVKKFIEEKYKGAVVAAF